MAHTVQKALLVGKIVRSFMSANYLCVITMLIGAAALGALGGAMSAVLMVIAQTLFGLEGF